MKTDTSKRNVSEYLGEDHDRLDALFDDTERFVNKGEFTDALERFLQFRAGLERHIEVEEKILFPEFEKQTGMQTGPSTVMRIEHNEIKGLLGEIEDALRGEFTSDFIGAAGELRGVLGDHNAKEEQIVYPLTDRALGERSAELVRRMESL